MDWIQHAVQTSNDVAMIFLSGHGVNDTHQQYRFLPYDYDPNHLERTTVAVFASSTGDELSWEPPKTRNPDLRNGAFAWAVLEGLRGKAAAQGTIEVVSLTDLNSYLAPIASVVR